MRRFMLGNMNPKMAATVFCSALLLLPKTKCRQNMEKRMENSTSHETCSKRYSSGGIASKKGKGTVFTIRGQYFWFANHASQ